MKYLKLILGLALIPLGIFIGSFIHLGRGTGAIIGGILGGVLCCVLFWGSYSLDEQHRVSRNVNKEALDEKLLSVQEASMADHLRPKRF